MRKLSEEEIQRRITDPVIQEKIADLVARGFTILKSTQEKHCGLTFHVQHRCGFESKKRANRTQPGCKMCDMRLSETEVQRRTAILASRGITVTGNRYDSPSGKRCLCFDLECNRCRHKWSSTANAWRDTGCEACYIKKLRLSETEVEARIASLAKRKITVLNQKYRKMEMCFDVECQLCGRKWSETAKALKKYGCLNCCDTGFKLTKPAILYYLRVTNPFGNPVYKIGITNKTVAERFRRDLDKITILKIEDFKMGSGAFIKEKNILARHAADRYKGPDILIMNGNSELFCRDVLGHDTGDQQLMLIA